MMCARRAVHSVFLLPAAMLLLLPGCALEKHVAAGRTYWVHTPPSFQAGASNAVVLVLHGYGDDGPSAATMTGMNDVSDAHGFVAVYPDGTSGLFAGRSWNAQVCCNPALANGVDDAGFLRAVLDGLRNDLGYTLDSKRIYVAGFSNGAMMALNFAARESGTVAAVAAVAGAIAESGAPGPATPVSLVTYHGANDTRVNFNGGPSLTTGGLAYKSADSLVSQWRAWTGCNTGPTPGGSGDVSEQTWTNGGDIAVRQGVVQNGNHSWPGGKRVSLAGQTPTSTYPASEKIWEFFSQHAKP